MLSIIYIYIYINFILLYSYSYNIYGYFVYRKQRRRSRSPLLPHHLALTSLPYLQPRHFLTNLILHLYLIAPLLLFKRNLLLRLPPQINRLPHRHLTGFPTKAGAEGDVVRIKAADKLAAEEVIGTVTLTVVALMVVIESLWISANQGYPSLESAVPVAAEARAGDAVGTEIAHELTS